MKNLILFFFLAWMGLILSACKKNQVDNTVVAVPRLKVFNIGAKYNIFEGTQTGARSFIDITDDGQSDIIVDNYYSNSVISYDYLKGLEWNTGYSKDSVLFFAVKVNDQLNAKNSDWVLNNFAEGKQLTYNSNNRGGFEYIYYERLKSTYLDASKYGIFTLGQASTYAGFAIKLKSDNKWHNGYIKLSLGGTSYTGSYVFIEKIVYSTIPDDPITTGEG